jgi:hypothetical protein
MAHAMDIAQLDWCAHEYFNIRRSPSNRYFLILCTLVNMYWCIRYSKSMALENSTSSNIIRLRVLNLPVLILIISRRSIKPNIEWNYYIFINEIKLVNIRWIMARIIRNHFTANENLLIKSRCFICSKSSYICYFNHRSHL